MQNRFRGDFIDQFTVVLTLFPAAIFIWPPPVAVLSRPWIKTSSIINPTAFLESPFRASVNWWKVLGHVGTKKWKDQIFLFLPHCFTMIQNSMLKSFNCKIKKFWSFHFVGNEILSNLVMKPGLRSDCGRHSMQNRFRR
jgi:hypothetical protein